MILHQIKRLYQGFSEFCSAWGRIHAAATLARAGYHKEARRLMEVDQ